MLIQTCTAMAICMQCIWYCVLCRRQRVHYPSGTDMMAYSTSLGCRRQPSLACHAWNHGKSPKSSPLSQQCRFHCHTWSAGESHYCVNSKGFMKFGTHTNEESDEYQQKWLPLSEFVGLCSKYIAIPYGSMAFILKNLPFQITRCF